MRASKRSMIVSDIVNQSCIDAPRLVGQDPSRWWEKLDRDFYKNGEDFKLELKDAIRVKGSAALDTLIQFGGASSVMTLAGPIGFTKTELQASLKDIDFYEQFLSTGRASAFFDKPIGVPTVRVRRSQKRGFKIHDGVVESLKYESRYIPKNPRLRQQYLKHTNNRWVHVRHWRHFGASRPTVVAVHGFGAEGYTLNEWLFDLPFYYHDLGFNVALFNLPFHGKRQDWWSPFSGHGFFAGGPAHINEAFGQAVHDLRTFMNYLIDIRGISKIGVTGISLGGYTSALMASTEPRIEFAIPNVPVISLADLALQWQPMGTAMQAMLKSLNADVIDARHMLAVGCPLSYRPLLEKERLMVVGGVGDRVVPPKHARLIWDHWQRCRLHWFPGSHVIHLDQRRYNHEIRSFLKTIDFVYRPTEND